MWGMYSFIRFHCTSTLYHGISATHGALLQQSLQNFNNFISNFNRSALSTKVLSPESVATSAHIIENDPYCLFNRRRLVRKREGVSKEHGGGEDCADWVCDA